MKIEEIVDVETTTISFWEDIYKEYKDIDLSTVDTLDVVDHLNEIFKIYFPTISIGFRYFPEITGRIFLINLDYSNINNLIYLWFLDKMKIYFGLRISLIEEDMINQYKLDFTDSYNIQFKLSKN